MLIVEYPANLDHDKMDTKIDNRSGAAEVIRKGKKLSSMPSQCWGEIVGDTRRLRQSYDEQWKAMEAAKKMEDIKELTLIDVYDDHESIKMKEAMKKKLLLKGYLIHDDGRQGPLYKLYVNDAHTKDHKYNVEIHVAKGATITSPLFTNFGKTCKWLLDYWNERQGIEEFGGG